MKDLRHEQLITKGSTTRCQDCGAATREGKPFCTDHYDKNPYARAVLAKIETKASSQMGYADDILGHLKVRGPMTIPGVSRELGIAKTTILYIVSRLQQRGLIIIGRTRRGDPLLEVA